MDELREMFRRLKAWRAARKEEIAESDMLWQEEKKRYGWELTTKANILLRLPIIRNVRYIYHSIKLALWVEKWSTINVGICTANRRDEWLLWAIYRGWA